MGGFALVHVLTHIFGSAWSWVHAFGSGKWLLADAIVTAEPTRIDRFGGSAVEIVYSYRFEGELYTGLHEEPCLFSESEYMERFPKGRSFVVRVKPGEPEISVVRDEDQADGIRKRLDRIDDRTNRNVARN
jgi:hypothetical protein